VTVDRDPRSVEQALEASEARLRHIVEHAQDLIYYCDPNGRFTYVNPAASQVMKYNEGELIGRHFLTLIRPDFQKAAAEFYQRQFDQKIPNTYFEFPALTKTGEAVWIGQHVQLVSENGAPAGVHAIARDISRQKEAEDRLRQSEARYRSLIHDAAYGIYRTTLDGRLLDANNALARMLGYESVDELMTRRMTDIYRQPPEREALIKRHAGEQQTALDIEWSRKDGSPILVHITARRVDLENGAVGFEGIVEDVTERRAMEEQLRRAQRMEAVGRLARGVAHDFNNVLAAITGSADLLELKLARDHPAREEVQEIQQASERGVALTKQLLSFSRRQALQPEEIDLAVAVPDLKTLLQRMSGDAIDLKIRADRHMMVRIEPAQLQQVLANLVVNARDAMPKGGSIDIDATTTEVKEGDESRYPLPPGRYARVSVRDTGRGIDPKIRAQVFEPFVTTKEKEKGTGLGLSIVYGIAKEWGGTVTFATSRRGTTFEVLVPLLTTGG
jgi:PAS domain S-box-containing protein